MIGKPGGSLADFFSERAIKVVMVSQSESGRLGQPFVGTEQLLIGLLAEKAGLAHKLMLSHGVTLKDVKLEVEKRTHKNPSITDLNIPFSSQAEFCLHMALDEAVDCSECIGTVHLLLAITNFECEAKQILVSLGKDVILLENQARSFLEDRKQSGQNWWNNFLGVGTETRVPLGLGADTLEFIGHSNFARGRYARAEKFWGKALQAAEQRKGYIQAGRILNRLASVYIAREQYAEAEDVLKKALEISADSDAATTFSNLGVVYHKLNQLDQAKTYFLYALQSTHSSNETDQLATATIRMNLGHLLRAQGDFSRARELLERSLDIKKRLLAADDPSLADGYSCLGRLLYDEDRLEAAELEFRRALELYEKAGQPIISRATATLEDYSALLNRTNRHQEAVLLLERAQSIRDKIRGL